MFFKLQKCNFFRNRKKYVKNIFTVHYLFEDLYTISKGKFNFKLIFVSLFLEMFRVVVKSGKAKIIFAVEVNLEGLCFSHDEIDDF